MRAMLVFTIYWLDMFVISGKSYMIVTPGLTCIVASHEMCIETFTIASFIENNQHSKLVIGFIFKRVYLMWDH